MPSKSAGELVLGLVNGGGEEQAGEADNLALFVRGRDCVTCLGGWGWRRGDSGGHLVGGKSRKLLTVSLKVGGPKVRTAMKRSKHWKYPDMPPHKPTTSLTGHPEPRRSHLWRFQSLDSS